MNEEHFKKIISHAKEFGFIFPSSEIYDGLSATYDYGQNGVELKNNIKKYWWSSMVQMNENIVGIDSAIFMHPNTWKASGHIDAFNDPLIDNKDSKKRYRADILIEDHIQKIENKINKELIKGKKRFGEGFNEAEFKATNPNIIRRNEEIKKIEKEMELAFKNDDLNAIYQLIVNLGIKCPLSGSKNWTDVRQFNLMFKTELGSVSGESSSIFLRPETAQGIFVNYLNVQKTGRKKIPFGIAQIGKAFRNEIIARQFIFRMREFEQMEMQFFITPGTQEKWYEYWKKERMKWHKALGIPQELLRFHDHIKLAHYADAASDIEFKFPFGFKELEGIHSRTDFDLKQHEDLSKKKLRYFDPEKNESYIPYVIETSIGLDRLFLALLAHSLKEEKLKELWKKGHTASQIAEILGDTTRNAVIGKAHRLKLAARATSKKSQSQKKQVMDNSPKSEKYVGRKSRFKSLLLDKNFEPENPKTLEQLDKLPTMKKTEIIFNNLIIE